MTITSTAKRIALLSILAAVPTFASIAPSQALDCPSAWYQRNAIYKQAGYCFKTRRAISTFGNGGCIYQYEGDVPLTYQQRRYIAQLRGFERQMGCPI